MSAHYEIPTDDTEMSFERSIPPFSSTNNEPSDPPLAPRPILYKSYDELTPAEQEAQDLEDLMALEQTQTHMIVDSDSEYAESGYGTDSVRSARTSMTSHVRDYSFENGRRYHKFREGTYNFPNEDSEQVRENLKHELIFNVMQQLHWAPIGANPQNIMDMGTGTGRWAIEMGDMYPMANIIGVDLSPIQPSWLPNNVNFTVDDLESSWLRPADYFDYIHSRHTVMAIRDWPKLLGQAFEHTKPGGYVELQEILHLPESFDGTMTPNHQLYKYWSLVEQGLKALGVDFHATLLLENTMREAGFVDVRLKKYHIPIGSWPQNKVLKYIGSCWREILLLGLEAIAVGPLTRGLNWTKEQVDELLVETKEAYFDGRVHSDMPLYVIVGQKPERRSYD